MKKVFALWALLVICGLILLPAQDNSTQDNATGIEYEFIKFFEGPFQAPAEKQRQYTNQFPQSTTRFVFFLVGVKNLWYNKQDQKPLVVGRYYNPDGSQRASVEVRQSITAAWENADIWSGWGWDKQGQWPLGTYRVEIFFGSNKAGEGNFTVYDDKIATPTIPDIPIEPTPIEPIPIEPTPVVGPTITFQKLQFFESAYTPSELGKRQYATHFAKRTARYVYYEVSVINQWYQQKENHVTISAKYYKPDGSLFGEPVLNYTLPPEWQDTFLWHSWGWNEPGNWTPGIYKVELWVAGEKFAEGKFTIVGDNVSVPIQQRTTIQFQKMQFFEDGPQPKPLEQRTYSTVFSKSQTRFVYYQVSVKNLLYKNKANPVKILAKYYQPDGSLWAQPELNYTVPVDWNETELWHGWGWKEAGNWTLGTYRVELWMGGSKFGESSFVIGSQSTPVNSRQYEFQQIRFFEAGETAPEVPQRQFATRFSQSTTRYIWTQVDIKNLLYKKTEHTHKLVWQYYNPDGTVRGTMEASFPVKTEWFTAWHQHGWGWAEAGNWSLGTYTVRVTIDGVQAGEGQFTID
jgi:hypothetical protein